MIIGFLKFSMFSFQSAATPVMSGIVDFNNYIFFYLILIFVFVVWMYCYILYNYYYIASFFFDMNISEFVYMNAQYIKLRLNSYISDKRIDQLDQDDFFRLSEFYYFNIKCLQYLSVLKNKQIFKTRKIVHAVYLEIFWTLTPSIVLILIAIPSFSLLYAIDEVVDPFLTIKIIGSQWFWTYEYAQKMDYVEFNYLTDCFGYNIHYYRDELIYDSVMIAEDELLKGTHRLLEVDHSLIVPKNISIRLLITATDVLHSWAVPSFGIKMDCAPGRMNQVGLFANREGIFYGQCSELCGVNHGFMPISVKVVNGLKFLGWYKNTEISLNC